MWVLSTNKSTTDTGSFSVGTNFAASNNVSILSGGGLQSVQFQLSINSVCAFNYSYYDELKEWAKWVGSKIAPRPEYTHGFIKDVGNRYYVGGCTSYISGCEVTGISALKGDSLRGTRINLRGNTSITINSASITKENDFIKISVDIANNMTAGSSNTLSQFILTGLKFTYVYDTYEDFTVYPVSTNTLANPEWKNFVQ